MITEHPTNHGLIVSLQLCTGHRKPMELVSSVEAVENFGLKEDMHAVSDSPWQVLLVGKETLDELGLFPGQVKENVTTLGIDLMMLRNKQRLRLGSMIILEITRPCTPCMRMEEIRPGLLTQLAGRRGMLARVVKSGKASVGDPIYLIEESQ